MRLVANSLNDDYPDNLVKLADSDDIQGIDLAVAYVTKMDAVFDLARDRDVPLKLYALADGSFPSPGVASRFIESGRTSWRLFLTRNYYHPKVMWFRGVGAYIGSANLTDRAWINNLECGIWLDQDDLDSLNWVDELTSIFAAISDRCVEATAEHLRGLRTLQKKRRKLDEAEKKFGEEVNDILKGLPGADAPKVILSRKDRGGAARQKFLKEWDDGLTLLRKLSAFFAERRAQWPSWVDADAHPSIVQDQATEWWYDTRHRKSGNAMKSVEDANSSNRPKPDAALQRLFDEWAAFDGEGSWDWSQFVNEGPKELHHLLQRDELRRLDADRLGRIAFLGHAAREHARQMRNSYFDLPRGTHSSLLKRSRLYAEYMLRQRSKGERTVEQVLDFVLWGDDRESNCALRLWTAVHDPAWKLPHLGTHILGELIGYARPDEFPPRNNRVSKTLYALGFSDVRFVGLRRRETPLARDT